MTTNYKTPKFFCPAVVFALATILLGTIDVPQLFAQKDEKKNIGIFQSKQHYSEFIKALKKEASKNPDLKQMIPLINDIALGRPVGSTGSGKGTASGLDLLASEKVRKELEIVDGQYEDLKRMRKEIQQKTAHELRQIDISDREDFSARIRSIKTKADNELSELLLPHQSKRLQQLETQSRLRKESLARMLTREPVRTQLDISDEQAKELVIVEKELERELEEKFAKLRAEAREKLLAKLNKNQRDQVGTILGESFEFTKEKRKLGEKKTKEKKDKTKND